MENGRHAQLPTRIGRRMDATRTNASSTGQSTVLAPAVRNGGRCPVFVYEIPNGLVVSITDLTRNHSKVVEEAQGRLFTVTRYGRPIYTMRAEKVESRETPEVGGQHVRGLVRVA